MSSKPVKIVMLLSQAFYPDPRVYKEAKALSGQGYEVTILAWDRQCDFPEYDKYDGIKVERIHIKAGLGKGLTIYEFLKWVLFYWKVLLILLRREFSVIHCHDLDTLPIGYIIGKLKKAKIIFDAHEPNYYAYWPSKHFIFVFILNFLERYLAKKSDCIIVTNSYQVNKYLKLRNKDIRLVPNYPESSIIRDSMKRSNNVVTFGRIGAIYHDTGVKETIEAFDDAHRENPDIKLILIGRIVRGYEKVLESIMNDNRKRYIEIKGEYNYHDLPQIYEEVDVSIMAYDQKSLWFKNITPTKFFESIAQGVPVIATDIGGIGEIIVKEDCGILIDDTDIGSLKKAILRMAENKGLIREMGERGRLAAREKFNWNLSAEGLKRAYQGLL